MPRFPRPPALWVAYVAAGLSCGCTLTNDLDSLKGGSVDSGAGGSTGGNGGSGGTGGAAPVAATPPLRKLVAGGSHACVIDATDRVFCWGDDKFGQLGNGADAQSAIVPTRVDAIDGVQGLAAGSFHTCAFGDGGSWCWGQGAQGQLGNGTNSKSTSPVDTPLPSPVAAMASGGDHTCALAGADKEVFCWGNNSDAQVEADVSNATVTTPTKRAGLSGLLCVAAGGAHSCVGPATGPMQCWGAGAQGQLGNGATDSSTTPVGIQLPTEIAQAAARNKHTCGITKAGDLYCWGLNSAGQLGGGMTSPWESTPVAVSFGAGNLKATRISAGFDHTCAISSGKVYCWGANGSGQLGSGDQIASSSPAQVTFPDNEVALEIAAGTSFSCALTVPTGGTSAAHIYCWGNNSSGQIGSDAGGSMPSPTLVALAP